jgi:methylated-DNA-[protein]-cysteine S-methyltransferase
MEIALKSSHNIWMGVACKKGKVYATNFGNDQGKVMRGILELLPFNEPFELANTPSPFADAILSRMKCVYDGEEIGKNFSLSVERFPPFTQKVLKTALLIPSGFVASYGGIAESAGAKGGARAVGNIMAKNPFAPLVPCHRVVASNLGLGGYGGGLRMKFEFLKRERKGFKNEQEIFADGRILKVYPVEFVLEKLRRSGTHQSPVLMD